MVAFRPLRESDLTVLAEWLGREHIQEWWRDPAAPETVADKYLPRIRGEVPTEVFVIRLEGRDVGIIQRYRISDHPEWLQTLTGTGFDPRTAAGIDYLIGEPDLIGQGIGTATIGAFTRKVFSDYADVETIVVTPQAANIASCRILEKEGYERLWVGALNSDDPSDAGEAALYVKRR